MLFVVVVLTFGVVVDCFCLLFVDCCLLVCLFVVVRCSRSLWCVLLLVVGVVVTCF